MSAVKKRKVATVSEEQGEVMILDYLNRANRPYSHTQIFENLHGVVKKAAVPRCLDKLALEGKIQLKTFKKTKIYLADQSRYPPLDQEALGALDQSITDLTERVKERSQAVDSLEKKVGALGGVMSDEALDKEIAAMETKVEESKCKLETMTSGTSLFSKEDIIKRQIAFNNYFLGWKKRKKAVNEMVEVILENAPKSQTKKKLFEKLGVETDEEAFPPVDLKALEPLFQKMAKKK